MSDRSDVQSPSVLRLPSLEVRHLSAVSHDLWSVTRSPTSDLRTVSGVAGSPVSPCLTTHAVCTREQQNNRHTHRHTCTCRHTCMHTHEHFNSHFPGLLVVFIKSLLVILHLHSAHNVTTLNKSVRHIVSSGHLSTSEPTSYRHCLGGSSSI